MTPSNQQQVSDAMIEAGRAAALHAAGKHGEYYRAIYTAMHQARPVDEMIGLDSAIGRSKSHGGPEQEMTLRQWLEADNRRIPHYRARQTALRLIEKLAAQISGQRGRPLPSAPSGPSRIENGVSS